MGSTNSKGLYYSDAALFSSSSSQSNAICYDYWCRTWRYAFYYFTIVSNGEGLALAQALHNSGIHVTVYERDETGISRSQGRVISVRLIAYTRVVSVSSECE